MKLIKFKEASGSVVFSTIKTGGFAVAVEKAWNEYLSSFKPLSVERSNANKLIDSIEVKRYNHGAE